MGKTQAAGALQNLAADNNDNKVRIEREGGIEPLIALLRDGSAEGKTQAARALYDLAYNHADNKVLIARKGGIEALIALLQDGSAGGKTVAARVLANLAANNEVLNELTIKKYAHTLVEDMQILNDIEEEIKASNSPSLIFGLQPQQFDYFAEFKAAYRDLYRERSEKWQSMLASTLPEEYTENGIFSIDQPDAQVEQTHHGFDCELSRKITLNNPRKRWCFYYNYSQLVPAVF